MSDYVYQVLDETQIRLLNKYEPWTNKVGLAQLIDEALATGATGVMNFLIIPPPSVGDPAGYGDALIGQDLHVVRDAYIGRRMFVGGGYGSTGVTVDENGNLFVDGLADFTVGGCKIREEVIATSATAGTKGEMSYGNAGGTNYLYVCVADNVWGRVALNTGF